MRLLDKHGVFKQLVMTATRLEAFANRRFFEPLGLSVSLAKIINLLKHVGPLTPTDIRSEIGGTKANVTQRLKSLEKLGLVSRSNQTDDRRSVKFNLTAKGIKTYTELTTLLANKATCIETMVDREDAAACQRILEKINHLLDQEEAKTI